MVCICAFEPETGCIDAMIWDTEVDMRERGINGRRSLLKLHLHGAYGS